ncbi:hypothetical protein AMELA_G00285520 [Ameiurus melas]|uniref:Uncharacterized protein n=1 Tax=Ameiurus melas TaxID=219545 RepID=A0A7J5ZIF0_AMEME|nr:hypothetical protein AMELA_G00285520 [Ameiurus melas]
MRTLGSCRTRWYSEQPDWLTLSLRRTRKSSAVPGFTCVCAAVKQSARFDRGPPREGEKTSVLDRQASRPSTGPCE